MRLLDYLLGGLALLALPVVVWWGIYQSPQSAVNLQARLEARASAALAAEGYDWAGVKMDGQRAILTGAAPSADAVRDAARVILRSSGFGGLVFGGVTLVESQAEPAPPVSPYVWRAVKPAEGPIRLEGHVPSKALRASLVEEARLIGRSAVVDEMQLAAGAPQGNFQGVARLAISQLARLESGEVTIRDYRVVLRGETADPAVRAEVMSAISSIAAPFRGEPMIAGDVRWRARLADQALTLSGAVSSEAGRREILALVTAGFGGPVSDEMTVGADMPEGWMAGVMTGLPHFLSFASGEMAFDAAGTGLFTFNGDAATSTLYFLQADMARSGEWRAVIGASADRGDLSLTAAAAAPGDAGETCDGAVSAVLASGDIGFRPGTASLTRASGPALDRLAEAVRRCPPDTRFEVEAPGAAQAEELADFLALAGVSRSRLAAISSGPAGTEAAIQAEEPGYAEARPLKIRVLERSGE